MKLSEIISITGKSGLYRLISSKKMPFTVEEISSGKKMPIFPRDRVTALSDISIYTEEGDMPIGEVFEAIHSKYPKGVENESEVVGSNTALRAWMEEVLPVYDKERVQDNDIKKLFKWYHILVKAGMDTFVEVEESETTPEITE